VNTAIPFMNRTWPKYSGKITRAPSIARKGEGNPPF
jgi:hypothetical protein